MTAQFTWAAFFATLSLFIAPRAAVSGSAPSSKDTATNPPPGVHLQLASAQQQKIFRSAGVVSASDVQYPLDTTADGIVVFEVSLNSGGAITNVTALTDIPPLTSVAQSSLQSWKFAPATSGGTPVASQMLVAFVFRHAVKEWNPPAFNAVFAPAEQSGYIPIGIFSAAYAEYPTSTVASGATVVQVTVRADGNVSNMKVVRAVGGGFAPLAERAAKNWQFQPANLNGSPATSKIAIAFVFSSRAQNPF